MIIAVDVCFSFSYERHSSSRAIPNKLQSDDIEITYTRVTMAGNHHHVATTLQPRGPLMTCRHTPLPPLPLPQITSPESPWQHKKRAVRGDLPLWESTQKTKENLFPRKQKVVFFFISFLLLSLLPSLLLLPLNCYPLAYPPANPPACQLSRLSSLFRHQPFHSHSSFHSFCYKARTHSIFTIIITTIIIITHTPTPLSSSLSTFSFS